MHKLDILSLPEAKNLPIQQLTVGMSDKILAIFVNPHVFHVHVYIIKKRITEYEYTESWRITSTNWHVSWKATRELTLYKNLSHTRF